MIITNHMSVQKTIIIWGTSVGGIFALFHTFFDVIIIKHNTVKVFL